MLSNHKSKVCNQPLDISPRVIRRLAVRTICRRERSVRALILIVPSLLRVVRRRACVLRIDIVLLMVALIVSRLLRGVRILRAIAIMLACLLTILPVVFVRRQGLLAVASIIGRPALVAVVSVMRSWPLVSIYALSIEVRLRILI